MKKLALLPWISLLFAACTSAVPSSGSNELFTQPAVLATTTPGSQPLVPLITPSYTPSPIAFPTDTSTAAPAPDIAPDCKINNEEGQLYLLSDKEFSDLGTLEGELDRALSTHYPEWASYRQTVSWTTQPVKLGEIIVAASLDEYSSQINPAVTLIVFGESVDWQLPPATDLFLRAQEISQDLQLDFDWANTQNESFRSQYPDVANSATYALYAYFNYNRDRLQSWCNTYQQLFAPPP